MNIENLSELFKSDLHYLYDSETKVGNLLPKLVDSVNNNELREVISHHSTKKSNNLDVLKNEMSNLGEDADPRESHGIEGLKKECLELIEKKEIMDKDVFDAAVISVLQRIEHYQIASYGTLLSYAKLLDNSKIEVELDRSLEEERAMDRKLTRLAVNKINKKAS